jgi:hypothetical protein
MRLRPGGALRAHAVASGDERRILGDTAYLTLRSDLGHAHPDAGRGYRRSNRLILPRPPHSNVLVTLSLRVTADLKVRGYEWYVGAWQHTHSRGPSGPRSRAAAE